VIFFFNQPTEGIIAGCFPKNVGCTKQNKLLAVPKKKIVGCTKKKKKKKKNLTALSGIL